MTERDSQWIKLNAERESARVEQDIIDDSSPLRRVVADPAIAFAKGIISVPEAAVGLADIVTKGRAGKAVEDAGFKFREAKDILSSYQTGEQQMAQGRVAQAKGFIPTVQALVENPTVAAESIIESLPLMFGGGALSQAALKGIAKIGPKFATWAAGASAPVVAGAVGEGLVGAGSAAENIRQQSPDGFLTWEQAGYAAASGAGTAAFGILGGKAAQKLGLEDIQTALARGGTQAAQKTALPKFKAIIAGALQEGALEELPQSMQEQMFSNLALGKPWDQGLAEAAAQGFVAGAAMGGSAQLVSGRGQPAATPTTAAPATPPAAPVAPAPIPAPQVAPPQASQRVSVPIEPPPMPKVSGLMLNQPLSTWSTSPSSPNILAQSPDSFGIGNKVVKLSQAGGGFGKVGTVTAMTGPKVDGNPNATVTVKFDDGTTAVSGFKEFGFLENVQQAKAMSEAARGKPFEFPLPPPSPKVALPEPPAKVDSKRTVPLDATEQLQQRINAARAAGDVTTARKLAGELDLLGAPPTVTPKPRRTAITPAAQAAAPRLATEAESVRLYHGKGAAFDRFDPAKQTPTGLGGKATYFLADEAAAVGAYGAKGVVSIDVPAKLIANLRELDRTEPALRQVKNIDAELQRRGYVGTFSPDTGEYTIYDPNRFLERAAPKRTTALPEAPSLPEPLEGQPYDTRLTTRPEATMPARPVGELGIERGRVSPVDPDLAAAVEDIRGGYAERAARELEGEGVAYARRPDGSLKTKAEYTSAEWKAYTDSVIKSKLAETVKEPWQMTRQEYRKQTQKDDAEIRLREPRHESYTQEEADDLHRRELTDAIKKGKPVPPTVLADYPELKQKGEAAPAAVKPPELMSLDDWRASGLDNKTATEAAKAAIKSAVENNQPVNSRVTSALFGYNGSQLGMTGRWVESGDNLELGPDVDSEPSSWNPSGKPSWRLSPNRYLSERTPLGGWGIGKTTMGTVRNKSEAQAKREHAATILNAARERSSLNAIAVEEYKLKRKLPPGYVREGDLYVFKGKQPAKPSPQPPYAPQEQAPVEVLRNQPPGTPAQMAEGKPGEVSQAAGQGEAEAQQARVAIPKEGVGSIYQMDRRGEMKWLVQQGEKRGFGDSIYDTEQEAVAESTREAARREQRAESLRKMEAEKSAEAKAKAEREDLGTFTDGMTPMKRGAVVKQLTAKFRYLGKELSRRDIIRQLVIQEGGKVEVEEGQRALSSDRGGYLLEKTLTKAGLDYAEHLIRERDQQLSLGSTPSARPAQSLSKMQVEQAVRELFFDSATPPNFQVTHNYGKVFNGREVRGWYDPATGTIWLNAAYLRSPQEARAVFVEEAFHAIQNDKAVQKELSRLVASLTPEQLASAKAAYGNISEEQLRMEAVADILEKQQLTQEQRGILARLWDAVIGAIQRLYGKFTGKVFTERDAQDVLAKALKAAAAGKRSLRSGGEVYAEGGIRQMVKAFYSRLVRAVEETPMQNANGQKWKGVINKWSKGKPTPTLGKSWSEGIAQGEIGLTGVNDLEDGKMYSKQEVLDYLQANQVEVKDVTLGGKASGYPIWLKEQEQVFLKNPDVQRSGFDLSEEFYNKLPIEYRKKYDAYAEPKTYFSRWQLPGAKEGSYREVLLTVPKRQIPDTTPQWERMKSALRDLDYLGFNNAQEAWEAVKNDKDYAINFDIPNESQRAIDDYRSARLALQGLNWSDGHPEYSSIANPIVRLRFNERTTQDGQRMLFLEEVQAPQKDNFEKMPALFQKNWREIAFKWALRHAAENGFDVVGWTTGAQQAERYSLEKQLSKLLIKKDASGGLGYEAWNKDGSFLGQKHLLNEDGLESYIGKEFASKAAALQPGTSEEIAGEGLKVGGEGLKKLYDVDFRNVVGKLPAVRNAGGKVGVAAINQSGGKPTQYADFAAFQKAQKEAATINALPLTPAIKDSVMGGQAMFSTGPLQNQLDQQYLAAVQRGDMQEVQALVDEAARGAGYGRKLYHGTNSTNYTEGKTAPLNQSAKQKLQELATRVGLKDWMGATSTYQRLANDGLLGVTQQDVENAKLWQSQLGGGVVSEGRNDLAFQVFNLPSGELELGVHLGPESAASQFGTVFPFYAKLGNPVRTSDLGTWNYQSVIRELRKAGVPISNAEYDKVFNASDSNAELRSLLLSKGVESIVYRNEVEGERGLDSFIALSPSQLKSADPITYDNDGQPIPLSQRFQQESPDIRYSLGAPVSQSDATEVQGRAIEPSLVAAAGKAVADLGRQQVEEFEQAGRQLEGLAYESKSFRNARSELNNLVSLHEGRLRQLPQDRVTDDMRANIRDGVSIENGQIVVGDELVTKLAQMGVQFRPELVKSLQAEVYFEQQARRLVDNLGKLATLKELRDYYIRIKAPADEILKLDKLIAAKEKVVANLTPVTTDRGRGQQSIGERAEEITRANASRVELQSKRDALTLEPVQEFFGKGITELRDLSEKAKAAADLTRALMDSSTSISEVARLGEIYDKWASFDATVKDALKKGTLTDEQRASVLTSLQKSFDEFDIAKSQMDDLLNSEEKGLLKDIRLAEADIADAKVTSGLADVLVADALKAAKGEMGLTGTVGDAANIANLEASTGAITTLAANLGRTLDQNRWLYDFLMAPGDMPAFGASVAQSLGISEAALREVLKVVQQSPSLASAIVTLTDDAAAKLANSPPLQMQSIAQLATSGNPVGMALAANLTSQIVQQANAQGTKANAARQTAARQLAQSVLRLRTLQQGQALFNQTANSPAFQQLRGAVSLGAGGAQNMVVLGPTGPVLRGFGTPSKEYQAELKVNVDGNALDLQSTRDKVWKYVQNAELYVGDYERAEAAHKLNPANPTPQQLGFDRADYIGLKHALNKQVWPMFLDLGDLDKAVQYLAPAIMRKMMKGNILGNIFGQYEQISKLVGGFAGGILRTQVARYKRGYLDSKKVGAQFQDLAKLQSEAMRSHNIKSEDTYRILLNEMGHYGREYGSRLRVGFLLPTANQVVTKEDMAFFNRTLAFEEKLRREVTEIDPVTGVRYERGGKEITRKGSYTGDKGMPRHLNRSATQFIADVTSAYGKNPQGFTPATDLSASSTDPVVKHWNENVIDLKQHILNSPRTDRTFKQSAEMAAAEKRIAARWLAGNMDQVNSVQDLVDLIAAEIPVTSGKNPLDTAREGLNNELLQYLSHAQRIQKERTEDNAKNSGLSIALSSENEFTKPAAKLELPSRYYDYGPLGSIERTTALSRANHTVLVDFANALRLSIRELENRLNRMGAAGATDADKKLLSENYGGNQQEMQDVLQLLQESLKKFEDSYRKGGPDIIPTKIGRKIVDATLGNILAGVALALRNTSQGQGQVFNVAQQMHYMSLKLALWKALTNIPRGYLNTAYLTARNVSGFIDRRMGRDPQAQKTIQKLVDVLADEALFKPIQFALRKPMVGAQPVRDSIAAVHRMGFDTSQDWTEVSGQSWRETGQFQTRKEQEDAEANALSRAIHFANRVANFALDTNKAFVRGSVLETSDTSMNALSLGLVGNLEQRLQDVAMVFGERLAKAGITRIDPTNKDSMLMPSEWLPTSNEQDGRNSLGEVRRFLENSASAEGFQLEKNLLQYYQDKTAGKPARVFDPRTYEAVQRSMVAENNAALPMNRAASGQAYPIWRTLLALTGYPADATLKLLRITLGGSRDRKAVLQALHKLPMYVGIAAIALITQGAAEAAGELWRRKMQGQRSGRVTPLDSEFWTNPKHMTAAAGRYLAAATYFFGDAISGVTGWLDGRKPLDPSQRAFVFSTASKLLRDLVSGFKIFSDTGDVTKAIVPLRKTLLQMSFGGAELNYLLGMNPGEVNITKNMILENAKVEGIETPPAGVFGPAGYTSVQRRAISDDVSRMAQAQRDGDTEAFSKAKASAQKNIAELEAFYTKQRLEAGDSPEVAAKTAKASVWQDYQEINPVTAALGGRRPSVEQYKQLIGDATTERGQVIRQGIKAWQDGAQALFGKPGNITKEDVAENRPGGTVREPSYGRVSLTGGVSGRMKSVGVSASRGRRRAKIRRISLTGRRRKISPMRSRRKKIRRVRLTA